MIGKLKTIATGLLAATTLFAASSARAEDKVVYALTTTNISVGNAPQSSVPMGMEYWKKEGLDVSVIGLAGTMLGVQQITTGQIHFATAGPEALLIARQKNIPVVAVYVISRPIYETVTTDEKIKSFKDLKGATIGLPDLASGSLPYAKSAVKDAGLDPEKDVKFITVGLGSSAANAIRQKEIAAWSVWDTGISALENNGFKFRRIDPPWLAQMPGNVIITHRDIAEKRPDLVQKFLRGLAKATVFSLANPDATIRNHWKMYPATKPQEVNDKTFAESLHIYRSRASRMELAPGRKWGESVDSEWDNLKKYSSDDLGTTEAMRQGYTNKFIDEANKFDQAAVTAEAKASIW